MNVRLVGDQAVIESPVIPRQCKDPETISPDVVEFVLLSGYGVEQVHLAKIGKDQALVVIQPDWGCASAGNPFIPIDR